MAWIVLPVMIYFKEALCQYGPGDLNPEDQRFGARDFGAMGYSDFYATPSAPKKMFNPNAEEAVPSDLYDMEEKITRAGKWPEFIAKIKETGSKVKGNVMPNWEEDVYKWAAWVKSIDKPTQMEQKPVKPPLVRIAKPAPESEEKPSLGMEMYWGYVSTPAPSDALRNGPESIHSGNAAPGYAPSLTNFQQQIPSNKMMSMAQKKIEFLEKQQQYGSPNLNGIPPAGLENQNPFGAQITQNTNNGTKPSEGDFIKFAFSKLHQLENILRERQSMLNGTNSTKPADDSLSKLPKVDDFNSPIRWVLFNSADTANGIAKVTDSETKKNKQATIAGTIYVPVVDYDLKRLGLTTQPTTVSSAILAMYRASTEPNVLQTVMENVNMKQPDEKDWLAFETILGGNKSGKMCEDNHCQSRCRSLGCQTMCVGDTCSSGCVGPACNSMCKGQGCQSMCIGDSCIARCDGLSCDARCRGKNCQAACQKPSCIFAVNGNSQVSRSNWNDYYQQDGESPDENFNDHNNGPV